MSFSLARRSVVSPLISPVPATSSWLQRSNTTLLYNGAQWRGAGVNWHWAGLRETTLTYPTHSQIDAVLNEVASFGSNTVIRAHTLGISAGLSVSLVTDINPDGSLVWNTAAWEPIDYVVAGCRSRGIRLSIPFTDIHNFYHKGRGWWVQKAFQRQTQSGIPSTYTYNNGATTETGVTSYTPSNGGFSGSARDKAIQQQFYRNTWIKNAWINNFVVPWFNHVNQYTGIANKDEPMIAFAQGGNEMWDSGDEYSDHAGADGIAWAAQFSTAVKSVAPNILVIDSQGADGANPDYAPGRNDTNTDILDYHAYNNHAAYPSGYIEGLAAKINSHNKAAVFQEYSYGRSGYANLLSGIENTGGVAFGAFWAIYTSDEGHTAGGVDDTVYVVGSGNNGWKAIYQSHTGVMSNGTPPVIVAPTNIIQSAAVANSDAAISNYASGSTDSSNPALSSSAGTGVGGGASVSASINGAGHKWIFVNTITAVAAPVTAGQTYTASAHVQLVSGSLASGAYGHISWYNSAGNYLSGGTSSGTVSLSNGYTQVTYTAVAPTNAAYAVPQIEFDGPSSGSAVVRLDQWGIFAGSSAYPWSSP